MVAFPSPFECRDSLDEPDLIQPTPNWTGPGGWGHIGLAFPQPMMQGSAPDKTDWTFSVVGVPRTITNAVWVGPSNYLIMYDGPDPTVFGLLSYIKGTAPLKIADGSREYDTIGPFNSQ